MTLDRVCERFAVVLAAFQQTDPARRDTLGQRDDAQARLRIPVCIRQTRHDRDAEAALHHLADRFERIQFHDVMHRSAEPLQGLFDQNAGPRLPVEPDIRLLQ